MGFSCCALLLAAAAASGAEAASPPATSAGAVSADIRWVGPCNNRRALERAMHERGAHLEKPRSIAPSEQSDGLTVEVVVHSREDGPEYGAHFEIHGADGTRDVRDVEANRCEELHTAIAWVLVVLARGPRVSDDNGRESGSTTGSADRVPDLGPVPPAISSPSSVALASRELATGVPASKVRLVHGSVMPKPEPRFALGAQLLGGWGFLRGPAWGPSVFFEYRPLRTQPLALRLAALTITNNEETESEPSVGVAVRRTSARLAGWVRVPRLPVAVTTGLEVGSLSARGSGALISRESHSRWGAWFAGVLLDLPLLRDRLSLEASADASLSPYTFAFRSSSERTIIESGRFEVRTAAGLKSSF